MLDSFQSQFEEQQEEVVHERERVALEKDAAICVQNQLATHIRILWKSQSTRNMLMIYYRSNKRGTPSRRLGSVNGSIEDLPLASNHHTTKKHKLNVVRQCAYVHEEEGKNIYWRNYKSYNEISLTSVNGEILEFLMNSWHNFKRPPLRGLYRHLGWS